MTTGTRFLVESLRSVDVGVPDVAAAETFFVHTWNLAVAGRAQGAVYLRGSGADHYLLALHPRPEPALLSITFRSPSPAALDRIAHQVPKYGGQLLATRRPVAGPDGGEAVLVRDPQGRILRFVSGDLRHITTAESPDQPIRLAHAVFNSHDVAQAQTFYESALGLRLSDRTRIMAFMRIPHEQPFDHHSIALADADNDCLNHIAFVMPDLDSVMRGGGRMKDAGYPIEWGPGRHGPGNNAFNYFVGPAGLVIEYTAEVQQIESDYVAGGPEDWKWQPGRVDHWGISAPPSVRLKQAQRSIAFVAHPEEKIP